MKLSIAVWGLLAASMAARPLHAQGRDRQDGLTLSQQVCAECHGVLPNENRSPDVRAPTFQELAATPGMTRMALGVAFTTPHAGMPMFKLTPDQAEDIMTYILSLR